ncbi:sigma-70 family RNA polymerase sigma factor, partial [Schumannella luteola]
PELDAFLRTEWRATVAAVTRTTRDPGLAEDAVQDALARYLAAPPASVDNLAGWITVVARNLARDRQRSLASERRALGRWLETHRDDPGAGGSGELLDIRTALAALPERQREVCALRFLAGCSVEQVARELGVTTGTVKTQLHRARRRLALELAA